MSLFGLSLESPTPELLASTAQLLKSLSGGAATGTGLVPLLKIARRLYGENLPKSMEKSVEALLPATYGGYPDHKDIAPSAVFLAVFIIMTGVHLFVFGVNFSRGHRFYHSLVAAFYCLLNFIGYAIRIAWAKDVTRVHIGLASTVILLMSTCILCGLNFYIALRVFVWRHARFGLSMVFKFAVYFMNFLVFGTIVMGIVAGVIPYLYFLSQSHFEMCKRVMRAVSILLILYSAAATGLTAIAFAFKPRTEDSSFCVYQPWWIQSFGITYFVPKGAAKTAEQTFVSRPEHHKRAVRVIASTTQHYSTVEEIKGLNEEAPPSLEHNWSLFVILGTSVLLLIDTCLRAAAFFENRFVYNQTPLHKPVTFYCTHGLLEFLVVLLYFVCRIDLRFYIPDRLPKPVSQDIASATAKETDSVPATANQDEKMQNAEIEDV